ncbi:MAG: TonB-dependent receptor [Sandaracinaceae bacterium]|nr:TonB-dependent receptor [Sandaracinaceae bacterium]
MSHRASWALALVVLASLGATRVHAQEPVAEDTPADEPSREGAIEEESLEDLLGLELEDTMGTTSAVSRTEENVLSAPASVTTLDARAIRLSGARTIPELLRLVTGVQVQRVAPGSYLVAMRGAGGITGNNVIIMLDGMPLNSPVDGAIDWSTVPIHPRDLERIDVVRGPVSTIYGANAYTGVIQLVSYRGFGTVPQGAVRAEVGIDTAGHPVTDLAGVYSRAGERFQRAVFAHASYDSVFSDSQSGTLEPRISGALLARLGATLAAGQLDFEVSGSIAHGSSLEHFVLEDIREQRLLGMAQLRFTSRDLPGALGTIGAFARTQLRAIQTDRLDYSGFSYDGTRSARTSVGSEFTLVPHPTLTATFGAQFDLDRVTAPYIHPDENGDYRTGWGFYGRFAWDPTDRWSFTGALRGDIPTMTGDLAFSYRGSLVYHTDDLAIRLVGASAFRAPTYVEVGGRFVDPTSGLILLEGRPQLQNPANDGGEIALTVSPRAGLRLGATAWVGRMRNLVIEDFAPIVRRTFVNEAGSRWFVGGDAEAEYKHSDLLLLSAFVSYTYFVPRDDTQVPTVGTEDINASVLAGLMARGSLRSDSMRYGLSVALATGRDYLMYAGVPTSILTANIDTSVQLSAMLEQQVGSSLPVWLSLRVQANLPQQVESPLPGASMAGTSFLIGVEHRRN